MMNKESRPDQNSKAKTATRMARQRQQQGWPGKDSTNQYLSPKNCALCSFFFRHGVLLGAFALRQSQVPKKNYFFSVIFFTKRSTEIGTTQSFTSI